MLCTLASCCRYCCCLSCVFRILSDSLLNSHASTNIIVFHFLMIRFDSIRFDPIECINLKQIIHKCVYMCVCVCEPTQRALLSIYYIIIVLTIFLIGNSLFRTQHSCTQSHSHVRRLPWLLLSLSPLFFYRFISHFTSFAIFIIDHTYEQRTHLAFLQLFNRISIEIE